MANMFLVIISSITRITAAFSFLGSSLIIYMILSDWKRKLHRPFHRLVLMMSIFDVFQSTAWIVNNTAIPKESNIYGAKGNTHTCAIQSFFIVLGLAVPLYNACLNIFYVLTIRYSVSSERFTKFEPALHAIAILVPLSTAITLTALGDYKPHEYWCEPVTGPFLITIASFFVICFLICIVSMVIICWTVISNANKMEKYTTFPRNKTPSTRNSRINDEKKETIKQALLYASAFIFTYFFDAINCFLFMFSKETKTPAALLILSSIFYPLQGFWNFVFYVRPGVKHVRKTSPTITYLEALRDVIFEPMSMSNRRRPTQNMQRARPTPPPSNNSVKYGIATGTRTPPHKAGYPPYEEDTPGRLHTLTDRCEKSEENNIDMSCTGLNQQDSNTDGLNGKTCIPEDIETQSKVQHYSELNPRRLSLVLVGSILSPEDFIDLDITYDYDS